MVKGGVSGGVTGGGAGSPLASAVTVFRQPRGTPREEPEPCGARWSQHRAHCPLPTIPYSRVRAQAQESLRVSGFELRWWILLSAASENQLSKVGPFPKDQTLSLFSSAGPSRLQGDRVPVSLVRRQVVALELSTLTPLLGRSFEMQTREEQAEGKRRGRSVLSMTSAVFL